MFGMEGDRRTGEEDDPPSPLRYCVVVSFFFLLFLLVRRCFCYFVCCWALSVTLVLVFLGIEL